MKRTKITFCRILERPMPGFSNVGHKVSLVKRKTPTQNDRGKKRSNFPTVIPQYSTLRNLIFSIVKTEETT